MDEQELERQTKIGKKFDLGHVKSSPEYGRGGSNLGKQLAHSTHSLNISNLTKRLSDPIAVMFGCHNCIFCDTVSCPHGIKRGGHHANGGCQSYLDYIKNVYGLMGKPNGYKLLLNLDLAKMVMQRDYYLVRLNELKKEQASGSSALSAEEIDLIKVSDKKTEMITESMLRLIANKEVSKSIHVVGTPQDFSELLNRANSDSNEPLLSGVNKKVGKKDRSPRVQSGRDIDGFVGDFGLHDGDDEDYDYDVGSGDSDKDGDS